ncbi:hypothetical protein [Ideonella sp.]|uniref:hypothetical protein n=1 Tax=Ideonella sp. TaxID=1929293 RepID=UPI0035B4D6C4
MNATHRPLHSLDAWPGESPRPPLRLLETPRAHGDTGAVTASRPLPTGWLQRLRRALAR